MAESIATVPDYPPPLSTIASAWGADVVDALKDLDERSVPEYGTYDQMVAALPPATSVGKVAVTLSPNRLWICIDYSGFKRWVMAGPASDKRVSTWVGTQVIGNGSSADFADNGALANAAFDVANHAALRYEAEVFFNRSVPGGAANFFNVRATIEMNTGSWVGIGEAVLTRGDTASFVPWIARGQIGWWQVRGRGTGSMRARIKVYNDGSEDIAVTYAALTVEPYLPF